MSTTRTFDRRQEELERLAHGIRRCRKCRLHATRTHAVPGEGPPDARIMLIGEGPGEKEDEQGRPFVGRSGTFLDAVLMDTGLSREEIFITSSVKCRPPQNRDPRPDEAATCRQAWLDRQIDCIRPQKIVLTGLCAIRCMLGRNLRLSDVHGETREHNGVPCLLTYHPTAAMRFPKIEKRLREDLRKLLLMLLFVMAAIGMPLYGADAPSGQDTWAVGSFEETVWEGTVRSQEQVREGDWAGKWVPSEAPSIRAPGFPADLSRYDRLVFWLYSEKANGQKLTLVCNSDNEADAQGWDYFFYHFTVSWQGWRRFDLRLGADVKPTRRPVGWHDVSYFSINASGWQHHPLSDTVLYLDGVRFVRDTVRLEAGGADSTTDENGRVTATWNLTVGNRSAAEQRIALACPERTGPFRVEGIPDDALVLPAGATRELTVKMTAILSPETVPLQQSECIVSVIEPELPAPLAVRLTATVPMPRRRHPFLYGDARVFRRARERSVRTDWGRAVFDRTVRAAEVVLEKPLAVPEEPGQWSHHYVCRECGGGLLYKPPAHVCRRCGTEYRGWPYDQVVAGRTHGANLRDVGRLGLAYALTGEEKYAERARENLLAYARAYPEFPLHNSRGHVSNSAGRVFAQTLDEAVTVIQVAWGYDLIYESAVLNNEDRHRIETRLFREMVRTIMRNNAGISNWQTWHNAGIAAVGFCLQDSDLVAHALYGRSGLEFQLANSILPDGFWYEGTPAYHYYALDALRWTVEAAHFAGIDFWTSAALRSMFDAPREYVFPDMTFPAVNDSDVFSIKGRHSLYELAYVRTGSESYVDVARYGDRNSLEALLWGADELPAAGTHQLESRVFAGLGAAVLRCGVGNGQTYVHFDYGPHGGGHGHYDKLALIVYALGREVAPDPGRLAYGAPLQGSWYRQTVAHNTVCVDGRSQAPAAGELVHFAGRDGSVAAQALCDTAYPGVRLRRTLVLADDMLIDVYEVESEEEHSVDWVMHLDGELHTDLALTALPSPLGQGAGYRHIEHPQAADAAAAWNVTARVPNGQIRLTMAAQPETRVILGQGMTGKPPRPCPAVLVRRQAARTCYAAVLQAAAGTPPPLEVRLLDTASASTTAVAVSVGGRQHIAAWSTDPDAGIGQVGELHSDARLVHWVGRQEVIAK